MLPRLAKVRRAAGPRFGARAPCRDGLRAAAAAGPRGFTTSSPASAPVTGVDSPDGEEGGSDARTLPRLPVPPLRQTLERYLKVLEPLVPGDELAYTQRAVDAFGRPGGLGETLQSRLERKAQRSDNWLRDWWMKTAFLENRNSLAVHSNPGVVLPQQDFHDTQGQLRFAAKLISAVLKFKALVDTGALRGNLHRGRPLCMDQYRRIFSSCRVPGPRHDTVVNYALQRGTGEPRHITVAHNYQFFQLDVYDGRGAALAAEQLYQQLEKIWNLSIKTTKEPIGILTAEHRNRWGVGHDILMRDKLNRESTRAIQRGIFSLSLDAPMPPAAGDDDKQLSRMSAEILHGGGSRANSGNRWFDKTLQFVIGEDGTCGLTYERAVAEGVPIMRIADYAMAECEAGEPWVEPRSSATSLDTPRKLYFNISSDVKDLIDSAKVHLDIQVNDLDIRCLVYRRFGKVFLKQQGLSTDAFIQMAMQLAYYRLHGGVCSASEGATTRMFHLGRTDVVRSTSADSQRFVQAFDCADTPDAEKLALLRAAIRAHMEYTEQAVTGQAIDAHLLGLKLQAIEDGHSIPHIFMDTSYAIATHFRLFTKQVPAHMEAVMCQGPVVPDGYGVCYNPLPASVALSVTALHSCSHTHASALALAVEAALDDMHDALAGAGPAGADADAGPGTMPRRAPWEATQW